MYNKRAFYNKMNQFRSAQPGPCGMSTRNKGRKSKFQTSHNYPPANVRELDDKYELYLFAPGYEKSDFIIAIVDDRLSISVKEKDQLDGNWKRVEFSQREFVRQFELSDKVDKESIIATYEKGVLILSLPKLEEFETSRQEIKID